MLNQGFKKFITRVEGRSRDPNGMLTDVQWDFSNTRFCLDASTYSRLKSLFLLYFRENTWDYTLCQTGYAWGPAYHSSGVPFSPSYMDSLRVKDESHPDVVAYMDYVAKAFAQQVKVGGVFDPLRGVRVVPSGVVSVLKERGYLSA
jgi:hypothetical protein